MITCQCNVVNEALFNTIIEDNLETITACTDLLKAVGLIHREALKSKQCFAKPYSCTRCFNTIAKYVQEAGLFEGQTLPEPTRCPACPRRAECLFEPA